MREKGSSLHRTQMQTDAAERQCANRKQPNRNKDDEEDSSRAAVKTKTVHLAQDGVIGD